MPKHLSWRALVGYLRKLGFDGPHSAGKHLLMIRGDMKLTIPNPHKGDISASLVSGIVREAGISRKDWNTLVTDA